MTDITAVLNLHQEGELARSSLNSLLRARELCTEARIDVEVLVVSDTPNRQTRDFADSIPDAVSKKVEVTVKDLGQARNAAVATASGRFVAFLDGDDLWSENWLLRAYDVAKQSSADVVLHPEANLYFGTRDAHWMVHPDGDEARGDWTGLALRNHWTALSFASRSVYELVPYRRSDPASGYGYEDWCWNMETIMNGFPHRAVLGTVHLIRMQKDSLVRRTARKGLLPIPNDLYLQRVGKASLY